ncbi:MAG: hypothetical protein ACPLF9_04285 [Methanothermobacter tenebrarum]
MITAAHEHYASVTQPGKIGLEMDIENRELDVKIAMPLALHHKRTFHQRNKTCIPM